MAFEQATIKVEREREFEELKAVIERAFRPGKVEKFLKKVKSQALRIRDWDAVLGQRLLEKVDETLAGSKTSAEGLYRTLSLSDQAQMREFYLSKVEEVDQALRHKFQKAYRYY
jgi:hypothetical protein